MESKPTRATNPGTSGRPDDRCHGGRRAEERELAYSGSTSWAHTAFFSFILTVCYQAFSLPLPHFESISVLGPIQDTELNRWPIFQQDTASSSESTRDPRLVSKRFWLERVDSAFKQSQHDGVKQAHVRKKQQHALPLRDSWPADKTQAGTCSLELNREGSKTPRRDLPCPGWSSGYVFLAIWVIAAAPATRGPSPEKAPWKPRAHPPDGGCWPQKEHPCRDPHAGGWLACLESPQRRLGTWISGRKNTSCPGPWWKAGILRP